MLLSIIQRWDEEREEWMAQGATRIDDELFHLKCVSASNDADIAGAVEAPFDENDLRGVKRSAEEALETGSEPNKRLKTENWYWNEVSVFDSLSVILQYFTCNILISLFYIVHDITFNFDSLVNDVAR